MQTLIRFCAATLAYVLIAYAASATANPDTHIQALVSTQERAARLHVADTLKVMSLNLAHGRKDSINQFLVSGEQTRQNLDDIAEVLKQRDIDVLAVQEADAPSRWSGGFDHVAELSRQSV